MHIPIKRLTNMDRVADGIELILEESGARCAYYVMDKFYLDTLKIPEFTTDSRGNRLVQGDEYMIITCPNGYPYYINITADSALTACVEVFNFIQHKL